MTIKSLTLISVIGLASICLVQGQSPIPGESPAASPSPAESPAASPSPAEATASPSPTAKPTPKPKATPAKRATPAAATKATPRTGRRARNGVGQHGHARLSQTRDQVLWQNKSGQIHERSRGAQRRKQTRRSGILDRPASWNKSQAKLLRQQLTASYPSDFCGLDCCRGSIPPLQRAITDRSVYASVD